MTRLVVGPFNRVEGDLELTLDIEEGRVAEARVATTLYRGFEQILVGRPAHDALTIAPRICGICSVSQSLAAAAALREISGVMPPPNGELAANLVHAAENIADHLSHFYLFFMPDFARAEYAGKPWHAEIAARFKATEGTAAREMLPARARLLHIMGLLAGKWPHSLALQPGGVTRALDLGGKMRLLAILGDFRAFAEKSLFGAPLEDIAALETPAQLRAYAEKKADFPAFLRLAGDLSLDKLGRCALPLMSFGGYYGSEGPLFQAGVVDPAGAVKKMGRIGEQVAASYFADSAEDPFRAHTLPDMERIGAYSFAKAPRLDKNPAETGAVARQAVAGQKLVRALLQNSGGSHVLARVVARVVEIAQVTIAAESWARALNVRESFCETAPPLASGAAIGKVEAARGALGHWVSVERGHIRAYQIIAPTTWNFSPRDAAGVPGPLEQALVGVETGALGAKAAAIQHVVRSFDPCMVCTAH
ncbi:hydrogenase large subunit [Rhodoblastus acidophilus]|uniref:nickel-dependent hydrogenase large subunit n=1 Tax=Rhodoblastus acidophilus TaxID=1074 RepID=UPI0022243F69|nr:nickel-dependent hydrogenase large subunit [Rhodoblastus acidophilus]MCW2283052.1 hydrogenase large subunit [Rhodoblastus acidophilus]MCW2331897.1 hydrogenase large subunit [Rhodoblastus acidophilus]